MAELLFKPHIDNKLAIVDKISMNDDVDNKLDILLDGVHDKATFLAFIKGLSKDWEDDCRKEKIKPSSPFGPSINGWENGTIGAFLEASHACGIAWLDRRKNNENNNAWYRAAWIIYCGKFYE